jgi:hypothetical protein
MNDSGRLNDGNGGTTHPDLGLGAIVRHAPVIDMHTHLFAPQFGAMNLGGIDELLTYHYLLAELFRSTRIHLNHFWTLTKQEQAELVWKTLFLDNTPISEAARGVVTILSDLGVDASNASLNDIRSFFRDRNPDEHMDRVFELAGVTSVVMTNDPFDASEMEVWDRHYDVDPRFLPSLRMDRLLNNWPRTCEFLSALGYAVDSSVNSKSVSEIRKYIDKRITDLKPLYLAVSLPDDFRYPSDDVRSRLINDVVLPTARDKNLPIALMVGVRRGVNTALHDAGDGVGRADVSSLERICRDNQDVRFFATYLSRENQHELCVAARKFSNLMPFGCWWFLNNPSIVAEITSERLELLGTTFIPQHSDARVLEQLIYKWQHSRGVIAQCLSESYERLVAVGGTVTQSQIERDVSKLFEKNFTSWVPMPGSVPHVADTDHVRQIHLS